MTKKHAHQLPCNQRFDRFAKKVSELLLSPTTSTKEHGAKQQKASDTLADLKKIVEEEEKDGKKVKKELNDWQHFLVNTEIENGLYKYLRFKFQS